MARAWSSPGRSALFAPKQILKLSFQKREALPAKLSEYVSHAMFVKSALSMPSPMMSDLEFGAASLNVSVAV
jgi:hypothetical protein